MRVLIIDAFEMVDVGHRDRTGTLPALREIDLLLQVAVSVAPVGKPGQFVVGSLPLELLRLNPEIFSTFIDEFFETHAHQRVLHDHHHACSQHGQQQHEIRLRLVAKRERKDNTRRPRDVLDDSGKTVEDQARIHVPQV